MGRALNAVALVLIFVCLLLAAWLLSPGGGGASRSLKESASGGGLVGVIAGALATPSRRRAASGPKRPDPAQSPHLVIDTLNLVHWVHGEALRAGRATLTPALIAETVDSTAPTLKARHPGRLVYVLKDRESQLNDEAARAAYKAAAGRSKVWVAVVERYAEPPSTGLPATGEHSERGRDDFYMSVLASRLRCAVLTADRLRDFARFRATVRPFHVYEYTYWRDQPLREYVRPESPAYAKLRKPRTVHPAEYFAGPS